MNLLCLSIPILKLNKKLEYTIILNNGRIQDYNHSIMLPEKTIILHSTKELLKNFDWNDNIFNISFIQENLKKEYDKIIFKNKIINTGILKNNEIIDTILKTTPIYYNKDSIKDSLWLLALSKTIKELEEMIPHTLLNDYYLLKKYVEKIKPINIRYNLAYLKNGFAFSGENINDVKKGFFIKNWKNKALYEFNKPGIPFYSLGNLNEILLELSKLYFRA